MMDNGIMIRNLSCQPNEDIVLKQGDQVTRFVNLTLAEIDTNENILESLPSVYEKPDDIKNFTRLDEKMQDEKASDNHHIFNAKSLQLFRNSNSFKFLHTNIRINQTDKVAQLASSPTAL